MPLQQQSHRLAIRRQIEKFHGLIAESIKSNIIKCLTAQFRSVCSTLLRGQF